MRTILVVANETLGGQQLLERDRASEPTQGDVARRRLRPAQRARATATSSTTTSSTTPRRSASTSRAAFLRDDGHRRASARSATPTPTRATMDAVAEHRPDEIIVSTLPAAALGLAAARPRSSGSSERRGLPVEHVVTDVDAEGLAVPRHARRRQPHAGSDAAARARSRPRPARARATAVHRRRAAGGRRRPRRQRGARRASASSLDRARAAGLLAAGMIGDPDPYTATMNALQFFRIDDIVISTLPETRSGWLRGRPHRARPQGHQRARSSTSSTASPRAGATA